MIVKGHTKGFFVLIPLILTLQVFTTAGLLILGAYVNVNKYLFALQIVMRYYGGRQISEEDLESALLVGMSPHERRRFEKKKGLSFGKSRRRVLSDAEQEKNTVTMSACASVKASEVDTLHESCTSTAEAFIMVKDAAGLGNSSLNSYLGSDDKASDVVQNMDSDISGVSDMQFVSVVNADGDCESSAQNGSVDVYYARDDAISQPKHRSKMSLLGHGPHGKQVVEHLLKEYGEDGIRQFCQRWRQVFVEAVHPRFLPSGWDITHRYMLVLFLCLPRVLIYIIMFRC